MATEVDFVIVATFQDRLEAELARGALEAAGIAATIHSDDAGGMRPALTFSNGARVIVRAEDATAARQVLHVAARRA
jgi:hypothetical protein